MKAVGYTQSLPSSDPHSLEDLQLPAPDASTLTGRDLLVRVLAVSVNPVDTKVRKNRAPQPGQPEVLGYDAVGIVEATAPGASLFRPGDRVWYAGSITRSGTNAELHVVDERIVGPAPTSLTDAQAAAMPLTTITAWELLFDRLGVPRTADQQGGAGRSLLVIGGAGGVGSVLIQLARQLTGLQVIATASRPETRDWCLALGAHAVIDHHQPLAPQLQALDHTGVHYVASLTHTAHYFPQLPGLMAPQGHLGVIDDFAGTDIDVMQLKGKCIALHWEMMFARSMFETDDMVQQHHLLAEAARLVDAGRLRSTEGQVLGAINAANLRLAHALVESGTAKGKVVLAGWA